MRLDALDAFGFIEILSGSFGSFWQCQKIISFKCQQMPFQTRIPSHSLPSKTLSVVHIFDPLSLRIIGPWHMTRPIDKCIQSPLILRQWKMTNSNALEMPFDLSKWQPDQCLLYLHNLWSPLLAMDLSAVSPVEEPISKKEKIPWLWLSMTAV